MQKTLSRTTVELLKNLDNEQLASCLFAACDLALRASRGEVAAAPAEMTPDHLVRQIVSDMPRPAADEAAPSA